MTKRIVRRQPLVLAAVAVFALTLGAGSTAAMASAGGNPVAMTTLLTNKQSAEDVLPTEDGAPFGEGMGLVNTSSRALGSTETSKYWIVLDTDSNVCLVGQFISDGWSTVTCTTAEHFQKSGISSLQYSDDDYAEAYLAPDGLQLRQVPTGLEQLESGLITGDSRASSDALVFAGGDGARGRIAESTEIQLLHPVDIEDIE